MKRKQTKHQHWVPQFYLRYFATPATRSSDQPQVWILSKEDGDGEEVLTNVRNVCGKRYLYSPVQPDGNRSWDLDEKLDGLENTLGALWPILAEGFAALGDESVRKGLALFVAVMHLRNPHVRKGIEEIHRKILEVYEAAPKLLDGTPAIESVQIRGQVHKLVLDGWQEYREWGKHDHDRFFTHVVESEAIHIAEMLLVKRWSVVFADTPTFITSDRPVSIHHTDRATAGFATSGAMIYFPLSPTRLLIMDDLHNEPINQYYPLQRSNAGGFNFSIWRGGSRFMISGRPILDVLTELLQFQESVSGDAK